MEIIKRAGAMFQEASEGAVLGRACESFLEKMENCFALDEPVLDRVKSMVENLELYVPKIEKHMGDHQAELEELKERMTRGRTLLNKLEVSDLGWFKGIYNDQLVQLDASLKRVVKKLRLQFAVDVKEVLVSTEKTGQVAKKTKRKVDEIDEKINHVQKALANQVGLSLENAEVVKSTNRKVDEANETLRDMLNMMKKQKKDDLANKVEQLVEGAALVAGLEEIADLTYKPVHGFTPLFGSIGMFTQQIFGLVDLKTAESKEMLYFRDGELRNFRVLIEEGVDVLRKIPTILEWTDELESEYTNKFLDLKMAVEALYKRLDGIRPFRWRCRNCDKSFGAAPTSTGGSVYCADMHMQICTSKGSKPLDWEVGPAGC